MPNIGDTGVSAVSGAASISAINTGSLIDNLGFSIMPQSSFEEMMDQLFENAPSISAAVNAAACDTSPGSKMNPFEIMWPKRRSYGYPRLFFGGRINRIMSQEQLEDAYWAEEEVGGHPVERYEPHTANQALAGGEEIGLRNGGTGECCRIFRGQVVGPLSNNTSPGGEVLNRILARYGFNPTLEGLDSDHVWEVQVSGPNLPDNMWPLNESENSGAGSRLSQSVVYYQGVRYTTIPALKAQIRADPSLKYYFKIIGFGFVGPN
jgi:hypothetical protein